MNCAQRGGGLPSPVVGWVYKYAISNYWRVAGSYGLDDLYQDGLECIVRCRNRYGIPGVDIEHQHFMSLVKTSFSRHLIDLTRRQSGVGIPVYLADLGTDEILVREKHSIPELPLGELARCIEELPDYLYQTLKSLLTGVQTRALRRDEQALRSFLCDC